METTNEDGHPLYSRPPLVSQSYPWLVISHGSEDQRQTFYGISQDRYYTKIITEMRDKKICASSHGWLVLEDLYEDDFFLLNLQSMEKIQLPPWDSDFSYTFCILLSSPSDPNCHIVFINDCNLLMFCKPDDNVFSRQELEYKNDYLTNLTAIGGKIYGITLQSCSLVIIEFVGSTLRFLQSSIWEDIPRPPPTTTRFDYYLTECSGEILCVLKLYSTSFYKQVLDFKVLKLDSSKMTWEEEKNIGQKTIFLDTLRRGKCCSINEPEIKRNSIYFVEEGDRKLYVFDLEDRSISMHLPCPIANSDNSVLNWVMLPVENN